MGMDLEGKNPKSKTGEYLRHSIWSWRPLAEYVIQLAPDICSSCKYWHTNDGDGLGELSSIALSEAIKAAIADGSARAYVEARDRAIGNTPEEPCSLCEGTDKRQPPPQSGAGTIPCNACGGKGKVKPFSTWYSLDLRDIAEFADFLADCGGFAIY